MSAGFVPNVAASVNKERYPGLVCVNFDRFFRTFSGAPKTQRRVTCCLQRLRLLHAERRLQSDARMLGARLQALPASRRVKGTA